jgi:hypothetical protein
MCPGALFSETASGPPEHEELCVDVSCHGQTGNALRDPQIPPDTKAKIWHNVSRRDFYENRTRPTRT